MVLSCRKITHIFRLGIDRSSVDIIRQVDIDPPDRIDDLLERFHIDCAIMLDRQSKVQIQRARQETWSPSGTLVVAHAWRAVEVSLVELPFGNPIMGGNIRGLNPQITRHGSTVILGVTKSTLAMRMASASP